MKFSARWFIMGQRTEHAPAATLQRAEAAGALNSAHSGPARKGEPKGGREEGENLAGEKR